MIKQLLEDFYAYVLLFSLPKHNVLILVLLYEACQWCFFIFIFSLKTKNVERLIWWQGQALIFWCFLIVCLENTYLNSLCCLKEIGIASINFEIMTRCSSRNKVMHFNMDYVFESMKRFCHMQIIIRKLFRSEDKFHLEKALIRHTFFVWFVCYCTSVLAKKICFFPTVLLLHFNLTFYSSKFSIIVLSKSVKCMGTKRTVADRFF